MQRILKSLFGFESRSSAAMSRRRKPQQAHLTVEPLEGRELLSARPGIFGGPQSEKVVIVGSKGDDTASAEIDNNGTPDDTTDDKLRISFFNGRKRTIQVECFNLGEIKKIEFIGGKGHDKFTNTAGINSQAPGVEEGHEQVIVIPPPPK